jgi:protein TonB
MLPGAAVLSDTLINGLASHKALNKELFIGALYSDRLSGNGADILADSGEKRMELRIVARRLSARQLNRLWIEGMAINNPPALLTREAQNMVAFTALIKRSLKAGDRLQIQASGNSTHVILNDIELGSIDSPDFFNMVLRTWIGPVPLSSDFRDSLLTAGEVDNQILGRYESLSPSDERRLAIAAWKAPKPGPTPQSTASPVEALAAAPSIAPPSIAAPVTVPQPTLAQADAGLEASAETAQAAESETAVADADDPQSSIEQSQTETVAASGVEDAAEEAEEPEQLTAESLLSRQLYHSQLLKWTYKYIRYPKRAINRNQEGSVRISVVIDRDGKVKQVSELEPSRHSTLNQEAVRAVGRADPFPPVPEEINGDEFSFSLPIVFRLPK